MSLAEIVEQLDQISQVWRSDTSAEQRLDLADLDDLREQLDEMEQETHDPAERIDELRGRIEVLMDEIEISLGIEPSVIASEDAGESNEEGMVRPQRAGRLPTQRHSSRVRCRTRLTRLYCIDSDC